ncbi:hypothetical protein [Limnoglobus roseus]|uniref:Membrane protein n=1 Tax=Limnoglobus roseus TaxID=2598579 RepID=A0A5C1AK83_9BACT|nr:hypothetical protein [Limnoglobus roseus]QEL17328.1 membrane protein [Limnoglobus roseus]
MPETNSTAGVENSDLPPPDTFFLSGGGPRLVDGGPIYKESPPDPLALLPGRVAEPWNTVTAFLFVLIVIAWAVRLRGNYRRHPFVTACLPVLLAGGIGGTLYHMHRSRYAYFILDVVPISLLGFAGAIYLAVRLTPHTGWRRWGRVGLAVSAAVGCYLFLNGVLFRGLLGTFGGNPHMIVNISYASLAVVLLIPLFLALARTRFRHGGLVLAALASFAIAWFMRLVDNTGLGDLPMGTHWLWHVFGAITTVAVMEYFHRLEVETLEPISYDKSHLS